MILNEQYLESTAVSQSRLKKLLLHPQMYLNAYSNSELDEPKETSVIGDAVDLILTQGDDVFHNSFFITDAERPTAQMGDFVWNLYINRHDSNAEQIAYDTVGFKRDKIEKVRERFNLEGRMYYEALVEAEQKTTISTHQMSKINAIVDSLRTNPFTADWIVGNENIELHKQVVLDFEYLGVRCKGLVDLIAVDRKRCIVYPIDIKTSSSSTGLWGHTMFWKFRYDIQAAFYSYGIKNSGLLEKLGCDKVHPFRFIVENQDFPGNPLVYQIGDTIAHLGQFGGTAEGRVYEGFHQAIERYKWHTENDLWQYPMHDYLNNGIRIIGNEQ